MRMSSRAGSRVVIAVVAVILQGGSACTPQACSLAGCQNGILVDLDESFVTQAEGWASLRVCVERDCLEQELATGVAMPPSIFLPFTDLRQEGPVVFTLEVFDELGMVVQERSGRAKLEWVQPNGPDCPPRCVQDRVSVS